MSAVLCQVFTRDISTFILLKHTYHRKLLRKFQVAKLLEIYVCCKCTVKTVLLAHFLFVTIANEHPLKPFIQIGMTLLSFSACLSFFLRHEYMPWLYYSSDPVSVVTSTAVEMKMAFQSSGTGTSEPVSVLTFYLAVYSLNGTYLGLELLSNQLQLCAQTSDYATQSTKPSFLDFGNYFENRCDFDTQVLLTNATETVFYDMYVLDASDNTLIPVPVRMRNYRNSDGILVNDNKNDHSDADIEDDVLTRRFFVYDTWSGRSTSGTLQVQSPLQRHLLSFYSKYLLFGF
jgi:Meckelin (Transmembrane protein 67)